MEALLDGVAGPYGMVIAAALIINGTAVATVKDKRLRLWLQGVSLGVGLAAVGAMLAAEVLH